MDQDPQPQLEDEDLEDEDFIDLEEQLQINQQQDVNDDLIDYQERFHQQWLLDTDFYLGHTRSKGDIVTVDQNIQNVPNLFLKFRSQPNSIAIYYLRNLNEPFNIEIGLWKNILADNAKPLLENGLISLLGRLIFSEVKEKEKERRQPQSNKKNKNSKQNEVKSKQVDVMLKENRKKQELAQSQDIEEQSTKLEVKKQQDFRIKINYRLLGGPGSIFVFRVHCSLKRLVVFQPIFTPTIRQDEQFFFPLNKNFSTLHKAFCTLIQDIDNDAQEILGKTENKTPSVSQNDQQQQQDEEQPDVNFINNMNDLQETNIEPMHGLQVDLQPHSKQALTWLLYREGVENKHLDNLYSNPIWQKYRTKENQNFYFCPFTGQHSTENKTYTGGILADDQGFAEKINMIALILSHPQQPQIINQQQIKTTLIVTSNQVSNWERTFGLCNLQVLVHRWDNEVLNFENYDVVIVSYHTLMEDWKRKLKFDSPSIQDYEYYRVILDQSSKIKNYETLRAKACLNLKTQYRWCVTSQALVQNNFLDLVAPLQFLNQKQMPCPNKWWFNKYMQRPYRNENKKEAVRSIYKQIMAPLVLRRTQETRYANGNLMIILPQLDENERNAYLIMQNHLPENQYQRESKLRKICDYAQMADIRPVVDRINQRKLQQLLPQATNQEREVLQDQVLNELRNLQICPVCQNEVARFMVSSCRHYICKRCYRERRNAKNLDQCPNCQQPNTKYISVIYTLNNEWRNNYIRSTKIKRIREILLQIPAGEKCVIFTQFIEMIHVLHHDFTGEQDPIECYLIHGAMPNQQRYQQLIQFNNAQGTVVLIASLKANDGWNLTYANHVIFVDPWWNYQVQEGAIQRVKINDRGFQNPENITVHSLIASDTIEVQIQKVNQEKRELTQNELQQEQLENDQESQDEENDSDSDQD